MNECPLISVVMVTQTYVPPFELLEKPVCTFPVDIVPFYLPQENETAIIKASQREHFHVVELLINENAEVTEPDEVQYIVLCQSHVEEYHQHYMC